MKIGLKTVTISVLGLVLLLGVHWLIFKLRSHKLEVTSMKCEHVVDGDEAVIRGKGLSNCKKVVFPGNKEGKIIADKTSDTILTVEVPHGTAPGKLTFIDGDDEAVISNFLFRDNRGIIIDFDNYDATWGGYDPMGDEGEPVKVVMCMHESVHVLPATPPAPISGDYKLLFQYYNEPWTMQFPTFIQYVAKTEEGGRGRRSIAGENVNHPIDELCLKFEVNIPKECAWKNQPRVEIFFGPYDCGNKHGREISTIAFWEPYRFAGSEGYYTDGWETITIPLTAFTHDYRNADMVIDKKLNLLHSTNFSFVCMGDPGEGDTTLIYMAIDNFRIVPIK